MKGVKNHWVRRPTARVVAMKPTGLLVVEIKTLARRLHIIGTTLVVRFMPGEAIQFAPLAINNQPLDLVISINQGGVLLEQWAVTPTILTGISSAGANSVLIFSSPVVMTIQSQYIQ